MHPDSSLHLYIMGKVDGWGRMLAGTHMLVPSIPLRVMPTLGGIAKSKLQLNRKLHAVTGGPKGRPVLSPATSEAPLIWTNYAAKCDDEVCHDIMLECVSGQFPIVCRWTMLMRRTEIDRLTLDAKTWMMMSQACRVDCSLACVVM